MYKLKDNYENFTVVDGPCAGRSYVRGRMYEEIPPQEARRFDDLSAHLKATAPAAVAAAPETNTIKTAAARKRRYAAEEKGE